MLTTGTTEAAFDLNDIVEEAFERCGASLTSGYDLRTARRSLDLLLIEWGNRGINLWTVSQRVVPLVGGSSVYVLPTDMVDVLDCVVRSATGAQVTDMPLTRLSAAHYASIPNKFTAGSPTQVWIDRQTGKQSRTQAQLGADITDVDTVVPLTTTRGLPPYGVVQLDGEILTYAGTTPTSLVGCLRTSGAAHAAGTAVTLHRLPVAALWPVPDMSATSRSLVVWYLRRMNDAGNGGADQDVPYRFLPALIAGLAYYLAAKIPGVAADRAMMLKQDYEEQWAMAASEDREKNTLRLVPHVRWV